MAISRAAGAKLLERMPGLSYDVISDAITGFACDEARIAAIRASRPGKILIGNVGALDHSHKGQGTIIEMAHRAATKHPDWHFMLCGDGRDEARFREQIGDLDNVELLEMDATRALPDGLFDAIAVTGSIETFDPRFVMALKPGGRLFVIVGHHPVMDARLVTRTGDNEWTSDSLFETSLRPLVNGALPPQFSF